MKKKPTKLKRVSSDIDYAHLAAAEAKGKRPTTHPTSLPLGKIAVADKVFQWRLTDEELVADREHVWELVRVLSSSGRALDPIVVTPVGSKYYVIDGHHRLDAYHTVSWRNRVPVRAF